MCRSELVYSGSLQLAIVLMIEFFIPLVVMITMYAGIANVFYKVRTPCDIGVFVSQALKLL